jgi:hypothetical protein
MDATQSNWLGIYAPGAMWGDLRSQTPIRDLQFAHYLGGAPPGRRSCPSSPYQGNE